MYDDDDDDAMLLGALVPFIRFGGGGCRRPI